MFCNFILLLILKRTSMIKAAVINTITLVICVFCFVAGTTALGQNTSPTASLNKQLGVYVFPAKDQKPEQQQKDESDCYSWAVTNSGVDPLNMQAVKPDTVKTPSTAQGMVAGGAKGAAAGVAIGAIAGDAGKGAAIGAVAGGLKGRKAAKQGEQAQKQQSQNKADNANQAQIDNFTKAYKACLTGKGYTVQ